VTSKQRCADAISATRRRKAVPWPLPWNGGSTRTCRTRQVRLGECWVSYAWVVSGVPVTRDQHQDLHPAQEGRAVAPPALSLLLHVH